MPIMKKVDKNASREIRDHRDNTSKEFIKVYSISQISLMDGIDTRTVKTCGKYLPVRVDNGTKLYDYKNGRAKKPYSIGWIRVDEIKFIYSKKNKGKKLMVEIV